MKDFTFGLKINVGGINVEERTTEKSMHDVKSKAGKLFHKEGVKSVCVYNVHGLVILYLCKLPDGGYMRVESLCSED